MQTVLEVTAGPIETRPAIRFFLGIDVEAIAPFTGTTLILGESELGVDWELGISELGASTDLH